MQCIYNNEGHNKYAALIFSHMIYIVSSASQARGTKPEVPGV
jgi:hypothetical protein